MSDELVDGRPRGWFHIDNASMDEWLPKIGPIPWTVYTYLVRRSDNRTSQTYPSYSKIAKDCGISRPTAVSAVATLQRCGLVEITYREKERKSNLYTVKSGTPGKDHLPPRGKGDCRGSKADLPRGKGDLPDVVNDVDSINTQGIKTQISRPRDQGGVNAPARASRTQPYPKPEPKRPDPEPPDDFEPDSESREYALAAGCDPNVEKRKFLNHYAKDRVWFRDPQAAFRSWIDKAPRFRQRPQQGSRASPPVKLSAYAVNSARLDALMAGQDPDEAERQARDEAARRLQEVWQ